MGDGARLQILIDIINALYGWPSGKTAIECMSDMMSLGAIHRYHGVSKIERSTMYLTVSSHHKYTLHVM